MIMKLSFAAFKKPHLPQKKGGATRHGGTRRMIIFTGIITLALLLGALLSFDAYLFYLTQSAPMELALPGPKKTLRPEDIDETIRFLDQRAEAFQTILSSTTPR